ncbi:MAG: hypothetical protein A2896_01895 [Candidatus Nealsonbacteria bacterium RIFCSPLOWO2_01_FULL_43_32]|uniref:Polyprenyl synthetase n=1 Tax=Candidatus Nealsonbacteria bacterium RIFCSPLOWO2_01_FULL_43_32 TaxID=1801672 RepID=A0A1G2EFW2_9BACT|nr:MAG: hypothetical protein A2896_01895 [Candidatus Nealsonbacteria bacterium RIFCSPLOWO2_01_FULL_43_32]
MSQQFTQILLKYQKAIGQEVAKFFNQKINQAGSIFEKKTLNWLKEYSLRPAKRIRAILVNQGYFLAGGRARQAILSASIFIELIHNYLLIHDDILDEDEIRRGKKTFHKLHGQNMAICAADMASALGYEILSSCRFPVGHKLKALEKLNQTLYFTCYGQMLELSLREKERFTESDVLQINTKKTAFYTLVAPLQIGALLAGAKENLLKKIEKFALPLGIAFQIRDDLDDGDIEQVFHLDKEKYQKMMVQLIVRAKRNLDLEKTFPQKEKDFLLNLADYCKRR